MTLLRTLDLFAGVGGFSYGLRDIARPIAYCECDSQCQAVIHQNMKSGRLPDAPLISDVTALSPREVAKYKPDMIVAGFPCQDISCLVPSDRAAGVRGLRSGLFKDVVRIATGLPTVKYVLLENSPCIMQRGGHVVIDALQSIGFTRVSHGVFAASEVGAPHVRRRWFMLASRASTDATRSLNARLSRRTEMGFDWSRERVSRVIVRPQCIDAYRVLQRRLSMLGNAVVSQVARSAFQQLLAVLAAPDDAHATAPRSITESITVHDRKVTRKVARDVPPGPPPLSLVMRDDHGRVVRRMRWRTPLNAKEAWNQCRTMTDRALWNPGNVIFYEQGTNCPRSSTIADRSRHYMVNPRFIEYLMGFPSDWTRTSPTTKKTACALTAEK